MLSKNNRIVIEISLDRIDHMKNYILFYSLLLNIAVINNNKIAL